MKLIRLLQMMLVQSLFVILIASVSVDGNENEKHDKDPQCNHSIPSSAKKENDPKKRFKLNIVIPGCVIVVALFLAFVPWCLLRTVSNWGSWRIHTLSPRPHYIRTPFGWVDQETWKLNQAKRAERKKAKRNQHKFYRTTKTDYSWIYYDPTGELRQRYDDQKKRSHLRFLPSWMQSYPHGTMQSGTLAQQCKVPNSVYQLPEFQSTSNSHLSLLEPLRSAQLDGCCMAGALPDPHPLPDLSKMDFPEAVMPSFPQKSYLLPGIPMMGGLNVVEVWHIRENPLPERLDRPSLETEEELDGVEETQEEVIRRDTRHRLEIGRTQETANESGPELGADGGDNRVRRFILPTSRYPPVFSSPPMQGPQPVNYSVRRHAYIEAVGRRIRSIRTDPAMTHFHRTLDNLMQELRQASGVRGRQALMANGPPVQELSQVSRARGRQPLVPSRPPVQDLLMPENVGYAFRLQRYILELDSRIDALLEEFALDPVHDRQGSLMDESLGSLMHEPLGSLMHELRLAIMSRDRLPPIDSLRPAVLNSQSQVQNNQIGQLVTPNSNIAVAVMRGRTVIPLAVRVGTPMRRPHTVDQLMNTLGRVPRLASDNPQTRLPNVWNRYDIRNDLYRHDSLFNHIAAQVNTSTPTIVTPQTHAEANRAVIEDSATADSARSNQLSEEVHEEGIRGVVIEEVDTDHASSTGLSSGEETHEEGITAITEGFSRLVLLEHDANLDEADSTAQHRPQSEESIRAEAVRQTTDVHAETGHSDSTPAAHVQDVQTQNDATSTNTLYNTTSPPTASMPNPPAMATQATATAAPPSQEVEDARIEELYTDAYP